MASWGLQPLFTKLYVRLLAILFICLSCLFHVHAQETPASASEPQSVTLPDELNNDVLRDVLSTLTDSQARALLIQELEAKIAEQEAATKEETSVLGTLSGWAVALGYDLIEPFELAPNILPAMSETYENFKSQRGDVSLWRVPGFLAVVIAASFLAYFLMGFLVGSYEEKLVSREPRNLWERIFVLSMRFIFQLLRITAFLGAAYVANNWLNANVEADNTFISFIVISAWWTVFAVIVARFLLSPKRPDLRLCYADDETASFLTWRVGLIFGWSAFTLAMLPRLGEFGWTYGATRLGFWFNLIYHLLLIQTIWQAREGIAKMARGPGEVQPWWERFSANWPMIAIGLVCFEWLVIELYVATGNLANLSLAAINVTLAILLILPLVDQAVSAVVKATWPDKEGESDEYNAVRALERGGAERCLRLIVLFGILVALFGLWGLSWQDLASQGFGAQVAGSFTEILLILIVAYGLWEALEILTERQIVLEKIALKDDPKYDPAYGVTRLETVLPLVKGAIKATIITLVVLAVLGEIGVNVLPLLAGAGVVGLAIGFGAQTLVRDIISGIFFLIDDAFRKDEYIDIGTSMGTVEKLSIRSMQLRHHDGPLNTIPFGEIRQVTNYSRDWGIMRIFLRVPYDTDVLKLGDLINDLGVQLLEDETIGSKFDVKLTAEGVMDTDDSALVFRCAYKTKALDQWAMRGRIYARIREMFEREGIRFANREVTVRVTGDGTDKLSEVDMEKIGAAAANAAGKETKS